MTRKYKNFGSIFEDKKDAPPTISLCTTQNMSNRESYVLVPGAITTAISTQRTLSAPRLSVERATKYMFLRSSNLAGIVTTSLLILIVIIRAVH